MTDPLAVLFVEDVEDDSLLLLRELRKGGYAVEWERVDTADGLATALARRPWDIVLSDYSLPALDGPTALRVVRRDDPDLPFILISGTVGEEIAVESIKAGAADYLMKGNLIRLVPAVRRAVREAADRRAARVSRDLLALVYHNVSDALMLSARGPDGGFRCVSVNRTNLDRLNALGATVAEADLIGRPPADIDREFLRSTPAAVAEADRLRQAAVAGGCPVTVERTFPALSGGYVTEVTYTPLVGPDGTCTHLLTAARDVTARRAADRRERELRDKLADAQKMEALGRLAGGVAHDFNNLLTSILGFAELAAADPDHCGDYIQSVLTAGRRAADLVRQVLAFGRRQTPERRPTDLAALVREVRELLRPTLPAAVAAEYAAADGLSVLADAGQLHQVLMNLCTNAVHAMSAGGRLTVRLVAADLDADAAGRLPPLRPGRHAVIEVRDTGVGMPADVLARMYEPFFTTKPLGEGTGLGLSVVHGVVREHDGAIAVESAPGAGTTFRVYLPTAAAPAAPRGAGEAVLVIDDDPAVLGVSAGLLRAAGYAPDVYADPDAGCRAFAADPGRWAAVMTDLAMPGLGGRDVFDRVRAARPGVPVVLVTGYIRPAELAEWNVDPAVVVLAKPFRADDLAAALAGVLARRPR